MKQINKSRCWFSMIFPNIIISAVQANSGQKFGNRKFVIWWIYWSQKIDNKKFVIWWILNYDAAIPQSCQRWSSGHSKRNNQVRQINGFFMSCPPYAPPLVFKKTNYQKTTFDINPFFHVYYTKFIEKNSLSAIFKFLQKFPVKSHFFLHI